MNKKIFFIFIATVLSIGVAMVYYFFGLNMAVSNRLNNTREVGFSCNTTTGKSWGFDTLKPGDIDKKLLMLSSGNVVICEASIDGYAKVSGPVVGYFHENMGDISVFIEESPEGVIMNVYETSEGDTKRVHQEIFVR